MSVSALFQNEGVTKQATSVQVKQTASSAEGTANSMTITVDDLTTITAVQGPTLRAAAGTFNTSGFGVTFSGNVLTVVATDIVAGDVFTCEALGTA